MRTSTWGYLPLLLFFLASCEKEEVPRVDLSAPVIDIISPSTSNSYAAGQEMHILVYIEENQELHDYSMIIRNQDLSFNKTLAGGHLHATEHTIDQYIFLPELADQLYTITVKASDHNGNLGAATVEISVP